MFKTLPRLITLGKAGYGVILTQEDFGNLMDKIKDCDEMFELYQQAEAQYTEYLEENNQYRQIISNLANENNTPIIDSKQKECEVCDKKFVNASSYNMHLKSLKHQKKLEEQKQFPDNISRDYHDYKQKEAEIFKCRGTCDAMFGSRCYCERK